MLPASLANHVRFTGHIPHKNLPALYRSADVLVNPSLSEAFGMSLIEAMACGVPVIATRVGGMTEIVQHKKTGLLVDSGDVSALANAMKTILADEPALLEMGRAARARVEQCYTWEKVSGQVWQQYQDLLNKS